MEGGVDPQRGFEQIEPELDIHPLQSEGVQFEVTFSEQMIFEPTYAARPSTQPSFTESFSGPPFTVPSSGLTFTEPPQAPLAS